MTNTNDAAPPDHFEADVGAMHIARIYAAALLDAAVKHDQADAVLDEFRELVEGVLLPNPQLLEFFADRTVGKGKKGELLQQAFYGRIGDVLGNFLQVLNEHERLELVRAILHAYTDLNNQRARRLVVQVRSAVPLLDRQRDQLLNELRHAFRLEPVLDAQVDPDLLGGVVVRVGDWLYDATVKNRLNILRDKLNEKGSYHATLE